MTKYTSLDYKKIGERIRTYRKGLHLSQEKLLSNLADADKPHFGRNTLVDVENGVKEAFGAVKLAQWEALCEVFNCSMGHLLGEYEAKYYDIQFIKEQLGLSENAVETIIGMSEKEQDILSNILEHKSFPKLIEEINLSSVDFENYNRGGILMGADKERFLAKRWNISNMFNKILDKICGDINS